MADNNNAKMKPFPAEDNAKVDRRPQRPDHNRQGEERKPFERRNQHQGNNNNQHNANQHQHNQQQHGNDQSWRKDFVKEKLDSMSGPTTNLVSKDTVSAKKFTGRCRLFVGNLPSSITDEEFRKMFEQFGEIAEVFLHKQKGFGFVKLVSKEIIT